MTEIVSSLAGSYLEFTYRFRKLGRKVFNAGIFAAIVATTVAWGWLLWTFAHWLMLAAIEVLV
jgi:hypothetical protein